MMEDLGFKETLKCIPIHIDNTSALHVAGNKTYSSSSKPVVFSLFYFCDIIQEGKISIQYIPTELNRRDIGTKFLSKQCHRYLFRLTSIANT